MSWEASSVFSFIALRRASGEGLFVFERPEDFRGHGGEMGREGGCGEVIHLHHPRRIVRFRGVP